MQTGLALSTLSTTSVEQVSECCRSWRRRQPGAGAGDAGAGGADGGGGVQWFQLYIGRDHDAAGRLVQRAETAGYSAIVLTVDVPVFGKRRAQFYNPATLDKHLQSVAYTPASSCLPAL